MPLLVEKKTDMVNREDHERLARLVTIIYEAVIDRANESVETKSHLLEQQRQIVHLLEVIRENSKDITSLTKQIQNLLENPE